MKQQKGAPVITADQEAKQLILIKAGYELRKKEEQLSAAILRVSVLKKKISIIKKEIKNITS